MKKFKFVLYTLCLLGSVSCQKSRDWECACDCKPTGGSLTTEQTTITNAKKDDANTQCDAFGKAKVGGNGTWKCNIY